MHESCCKVTAESNSEVFLKSANVAQSYERISSGTFLWPTVYTITTGRQCSLGALVMRFMRHLPACCQLVDNESK